MKFWERQDGREYEEQKYHSEIFPRVKRIIFGETQEVEKEFEAVPE